MKMEEFFNDFILIALSLFLIATWGTLRFRFQSTIGTRGETSAATILRMACGLLLAAASLDKLGDPSAFSRMIKECYDILPGALIPLAAIVIPWLEFFTGLCLILGWRWRGAALVFCGLMAVYALTITWDLFKGIDCNCGCFKMDSKEKMTWWTVLRDVGFFGMGFIVLVSPRTFIELDRSNNQKSF